MNRILNLRTVLSASLLTALTLQAAPMRRADVNNDPVWVVHVDADGLRKTVIGQHILGELEKPEAQKKLVALQAIFSFDLRKDLHGVTIYSVSKAEEDGVLLVNADFDAVRLTTLAEGAKEHKFSTHRQYTIHNWIDERKKAKEGVKPRIYAAIHGQTVIFAQKESRVAEALDVLDRAKPNLAANKQFAALGNGPAFLQGAARKLDLQDNDPSAAVFKQSKMIRLNVGETERKVQAALTLETDNEEAAGQIESIGRGLIGLLSLRQGKPEVQKLVRGLVVQKEGAAVTVNLSLPADDLIEMLKSMEAKKQTEKADE